MANSVQEKDRIHHDAKQWQHCSLFNLDLFNDDRHHLHLSKPAGESIEVGACHCYCSASSNDVDDAAAAGKQRLNHSCSFAVLQKNYTTQLEHVAERLLSNENNYSVDCPCCPSDTTDTKVQSINRKILLGSTAILDNFLRNNLRTALTINVNNPTSCFPSSSSSSATTDASHANVTSTIMAGTGNQRRWHSERGSRHPNVRANLPLTSAQRQVLERYMNYPLIKAPVNRTNIRRSYHHHRPLIGKAGENTGTALAALAEQPFAPLTTVLPPVSVNLRKESAPLIQTHARPLSSTSSSTSAASHHSTLSRRCFLADTIPQSGNADEYSDDDDDDNDSISSEQDHTSDEESDVLIEPSPLLAASDHHLTLSETLSECTICYELRRLLKRPCCDFSACSSCLNNYVEQQVRQGIIRMQCPNHQCHIYMHRDEIHKRCVSPELRQKFTRFLLETNRSINMKTCPRCSFIHEIDLELCRSTHRTPTKVQCVECSLIWCFQCHSPWHDGIQCKEFRRGDRMLKKWAREVHYGQQNAQQCPSCKVYIQRTKGCDHIICLRCKTEFCYRCGDRFRDIKFIGDHYSELSVLGCKYRFHPDNPLKRRLIRGSILGAKVLAAPMILCLAMVAGTLCAGIGLPAYCCCMIVRQIKAKRRRNHHARLKEPVLMSYKALNEVVPQLIPRDPVNSDGVKPGFNSIRTNPYHHADAEIVPTGDAPMAIFDDEFNVLSARSSSPNFPRLMPCSTLRRSLSTLNE